MNAKKFGMCKKSTRKQLNGPRAGLGKVTGNVARGPGGGGEEQRANGFKRPYSPMYQPSAFLPRFSKPLVNLAKPSCIRSTFRFCNTRPMATNGSARVSDSRPVFFFDIDNCVSEDRLHMVCRTLSILICFSSFTPKVSWRNCRPQ